MAREVIVLGICDLHGERMPEAEMSMDVKLTFLDQEVYLDLCDDGMAEMENVLQQYFVSGHKAPNDTKPPTPSKPSKRQCPYCSFATDSAPGMKRHLTRRAGDGDHPDSQARLAAVVDRSA